MPTISRFPPRQGGCGQAAIFIFLALQLLLFSCPVNGAVPGWRATGSLITGREAHTAVLLPIGKVLVAGGGGPTLSSGELFQVPRALGLLMLLLED